MQRIKHFFKNLKIEKNTALVAIAIVGVLIVTGLIYAKNNPGFSVNGIAKIFTGGPSDKAIAQKAVDYINDNKLAQTPATLAGDVTQESGLVKFKIQIGSNSFDTYATKDGNLFFPQVFNMGKKDDAKATAEDTPKGEAATTITKSDSPILEAYVVSRCPFGLQMQRAMDAAVQAVPDLAKYIKVRYMGSVASNGTTISSMHGDAEAVENLRQICIREEQPAKYWPYVACQMKKGGTEKACEVSTGVDSAKLTACTTDPAKGIAYAKKDFELTNKYGVTGSPTLILSGASISENTYGGRSAEGVKGMVCAGFNNQPGFCKTKLDSTSAATSFSITTAPAAGSGNSGSGGANCAPAQ